MSAARNGAERFDPPDMRFPGMSQAVRCGEWILVSGQVALKNGQVVGAGDPAAQARQCFDNIAAVLTETGASLGDIVSLRCFLTDNSAYRGYAEVKGMLFQNEAPASTTVIINALLIPGLLMEVEAVAWMGKLK
jgi:enamine deaminase RidA (YjgF/YER057c/UK114 family)